MRITEKGSTNEATIDKVGKGLVIVDHSEADVHNGQAYSVSVSRTNLASSTVADGTDIFSIGFRTGANQNAHVTFSAFGSAQYQIDLFRGSSLSGLGTPTDPENRLEGGPASKVLVFVGTSSTGATGFGVNRLSGISPGGESVGNKNFGGGREESDEWIFTTASTGVLRIRNLTTATMANYSLALGFHEE